MSFFMLKIYLPMSICNTTENKRKLNRIYFSVILQRNVTRSRTFRISVITDLC